MRALAFLADLGRCVPNLRRVTLDAVSSSIEQRLSVGTVALEQFRVEDESLEAHLALQSDIVVVMVGGAWDAFFFGRVPVVGRRTGHAVQLAV